MATTWQFGLPGPSNPPIQLPTGLESFVPLPSAVLQIAGLGFPNQALRLSLLPFSPGTTISAQMICVILDPAPRVPAGLGLPPCAPGLVSHLTASPAMWIVTP